MKQLQFDFDEPIRAIHIGPTNTIADLSILNGGMDMVLTHLVLNDEAYKTAFMATPSYKLLDNSFFELGYCLSPTAMLEAAELVEANCLICPDGTLDGMDEFLAAGYDVMTIPKSAAQFKDMMYDNRITFVGVSEEHIDYRHSPGARYELFRDHLDEGMPTKKIHLLGGTDSIYEIGMLHPFKKHISSWDSSACVWQGHLGIKVNEMKQKDTTSVNFSTEVDLMKPEVAHNIEFVSKLLKGVQYEG